jgi:hypothetical protein
VSIGVVAQHGASLPQLISLRARGVKAVTVRRILEGLYQSSGETDFTRAAAGGDLRALVPFWIANAGTRISILVKDTINNRWY